MTIDQDGDGKYVKNVRRRITEKDLTRITLPREHWGAKVEKIQDDDVRPIVSRFCKKIDTMVENGYGLVIMGARGVGKTSCAAIILKEAIRRYVSGYFITYPRLRDLQFEGKNALYGDGTDGVTIRQKIMETSLLVIDGINLEFFTDNVFGPAKLAALISERRQNLLSTILTGSFGRIMDRDEYSDLKHEIGAAMQAIHVDGANMYGDKRAQMQSVIMGDD